MPKKISKKSLEEKKSCSFCDSNIPMVIFVAVGVLLIGFFFTKIMFKDYDGIRTYFPCKQKTFQADYDFNRCLTQGKLVPNTMPRRCIFNDGTMVSETKKTMEPKTDISNKINVTSPMPNTVISSPLVISGNAVGNWYFEGSFPIELLDASRQIIAEGYLSAQGEWMTEEFVPFKGTLEFKKTTSQNGFLILKKDNPSGLTEMAEQIEIPVLFK